jgi:hypothetical protein
MAESRVDCPDAVLRISDDNRLATALEHLCREAQLAFRALGQRDVEQEAL